MKPADPTCHRRIGQILAKQSIASIADAIAGTRAGVLWLIGEWYLVDGPCNPTWPSWVDNLAQHMEHFGGCDRLRLAQYLESAFIEHRLAE